MRRMTKYKKKKHTKYEKEKKKRNRKEERPMYTYVYHTTFEKWYFPERYSHRVARKGYSFFFILRSPHVSLPESPTGVSNEPTRCARAYIYIYTTYIYYTYSNLSSKFGVRRRYGLFLILFRSCLCTHKRAHTHTHIYTRHKRASHTCPRCHVGGP